MAEGSSGKRRFLDSPWPYFTGAALLALVAIAAQLEFRAPSRPVGTPQDLLTLRDRPHLNVVFLLIDTLRADRLGAYGYPRETSPNLDALAAGGILFRNTYSQSSWTKSSMASIWTGTYPAHNGIVRFDDTLPPEAVMPAEILKEAGYRTVGLWRNGWVAPNFGFDQGFDNYLNPRTGRAQREVARGHPSGDLAGTDEDVVIAASEFLGSFGQEPFFLYLHLMDVHQYVYDDRAPHFGNSYSDIYDQSINWSDRVVAYFVNRIEEIGQLENTVLVVTSDHGEAFREHGREGHAHDLHAEVVKVPFLIVLPFALESGIVVDEIASNVDVWPTILDLLGLPSLPRTDGRSMVPEIFVSAGLEPPGGAAPAPRVQISHLNRFWGQRKEHNPVVAVTDGDLRVIWQPRRPSAAKLYDLAADPREKTNLFRPDDPESERMRALAQGYLDDAKSVWEGEPQRVELDQMRLNQLRALGYMIR